MKNLRHKLVMAFAGVALSASAGSQRIDFDQATLEAAANDANVTETEGQCDVPENMANGRVYVERSCVTLSDFLQDPAAYQNDASYDSLMMLFNSASFGREMLEYVAETDPEMRLCDMELSDAERAVYNGMRIGVDYSRDRDQISYYTSVVHEMAHHYQYQNGAQPFDVRRSLADNQRALLAMETAAPVVEMLALFNAAEDGSADWRASLSPMDEEYMEMVGFTARYEELRENGSDPAEALNAAAFHMWQDTLRHQGLLDAYNSTVVRFTLMEAEKLQADFVDHRDLSVQWTILQSGNMGGGINFTRLTEMPKSDALFGTNDGMREIFDAVEWYRGSRMLGADHADVRAEKAALAADGNRFVHADFEDITCKIRQGTEVEAAFNAVIEESPAPKTPPVTTARKSGPGV